MNFLVGLNRLQWMTMGDNGSMESGKMITKIEAVNPENDLQNAARHNWTELVVEEPKVMDRGNWGGKLEFILTCVGYAVGLGNVWRFPYLAYKNGGGAFLIPYWFMQIFVGMPLFYMELCFGQFASLGPLAIWKINPLFKGLGYCSVICSALIGLYYNVIIGYCIYYFFASMTDPLPWALGDDINSGSNITNLTMTTGGNTSNTSTVLLEKSESEKYFYGTVLNMSTGLEDIGGVQWQLALCLLAAWVIVLIVLSKGIQSLGKVVYFTATFPYLLLTALLIRGATLPGASDGIRYYLTPSWERLQDSTVWSDAATQVFYSLSACSGGLILMSSFNKFDNFCLRDALIVPCVDCLTSFFSGFVIFTVLGFMAKAKGVKIEDVATGGSGLAFVVYPEAIANMPAPTVWAVLFFFMLLVIGFSSQFSIMECVMSSFIDEYPHVLRKNWRNSFLFRMGVAAFFYLMALPMTTRGGLYLLELIDSAVSGFPLLFVGLLECIVINWIYGYSKFAKDIQMMMKRTPWSYWAYCWCGKTPLVLSVVIIFKAVQYEKITLLGYVYPAWGEMLWWLVTLFPILAIPGWFLFYYCKHGGWQVLKKLMTPLPDWGPADDANRDGIRYKKKSALKMEVLNRTSSLGYSSGNYNDAFKDDENLSLPGQNFKYSLPPDYEDATHM
ncbi:sodium- and chloride-dependent glycine transporter 1-like isoform X1 [Mizuhopecten yessoensis]|uniref:sodium- and chloride-dependent glycine transporter 1-like isoform X1 n=2 Tax=Mizuhopecten yessoensis TaxID=6573 RepID=UPI000B457AA3|nr:sodium- and chloride-dependent glycine transporter 1-like isoform X1 [Mizuhopecten yessoensis]